MLKNELTKQDTELTTAHYALFGGSFNPIHLGHVAIVRYLLSASSVSEVIIMPTQCSPLKAQDSLLPKHLRWDMVSQTFKGWEHVTVSDLELQQPNVSYTHTTLKTLVSQSPAAHWHLVIGLDNFLAFHQWKAPKQILEMASLWIIRRPQQNSIEEIHTSDTLRKINQWFASLVWSKQQQVLYQGNRELLRFMDFSPPHVSSTAIREGLQSVEWIPENARSCYENYQQQHS
ncbi:nicotinate (nicotinamide) nucleotide adenylyltransferase [Deltaproteobacteria bacterium TL4]